MNLATVFDRHHGDDVALISRARPRPTPSSTSGPRHLRAGLAEAGLEPGDRLAIVCSQQLVLRDRRTSRRSAPAWWPCRSTRPARRSSSRPSSPRSTPRAIVIGPGGRAGRRAARPIRASRRSSVFIGCGFTPDGGVSLDDLEAAEPAADRRSRRRRPGRARLHVAAPPARPRRRCSATATCARTSPRCCSVPGHAQTRDDVVFGVLPMFHIFGLNVVLGATLAVGLEPAADRALRPDRRRSRRSRSTRRRSSPGPPDHVGGVGRASPALERDSFSTVRLAVSGAARLSDEIARRPSSSASASTSRRATA